jgi:hypothetical protein
VDTNSSPNDIDYIIPSNDDSRGTAEVITSSIIESFLKGKKSIPMLDDTDDDFIEVDGEGNISKDQTKRKKRIFVADKKITKKKVSEDKVETDDGEDGDKTDDTRESENLDISREEEKKNQDINSDQLNDPSNNEPSVEEKTKPGSELPGSSESEDNKDKKDS